LHVELAERADLVAIVPATADLLARLAQGRADDVVTALALCARCPVLVAPAMHPRMWEHPATLANVATLAAQGRVTLVGPVSGEVASGDIGMGRMAEPEAIAAAASALLSPGDLAGRRIAVTAGPTVEDIDPVRFLTNRSSGKMGYALAEAAQRRGARVILISGPTDLKVPDGVDWVPVRTTTQMHDAVLSRAAECSVVVMAAAVSDYRPAATHDKKIKRGEGSLALQLEPTADILAELGRAKRNQVLVGFAAETDSVAEHARGKLERKAADMIVANDVTQEGAGFDTDTNIVTLYTRDGREVALPKLSKFDVANRIFDRVLEIVRDVAALGMEVCCSLGMLEPSQAERLAAAGLRARHSSGSGAGVRDGPP